MPAKAGVIGFTKGVARELAPYNITVNVAAPAITESKRLKNLIENEQDDFNSWIQLIPLHSVAQPEEVSAAIVFLTSEDASYITGTVLCVDGGYSMH